MPLDEGRARHTTSCWWANPETKEPKPGPDCAGPLTAEHVTPVSVGGESFSFENLTTRCRYHNSARGGDGGVVD